MNKKIMTSVRLSGEAKRLVKVVADQLGVSQAAVIEMAIRLYARKVEKKDNPKS